MTHTPSIINYHQHNPPIEKQPRDKPPEFLASDWSARCHVTRASSLIGPRHSARATMQTLIVSKFEDYFVAQSRSEYRSSAYMIALL